MTQNRKSEIKRVNRTEYERMKSAGSLDSYQIQAGDMFHELMHRSHYGVPAMDPSRTPVDGGKISFEIPDHVIDCQNKIGKATQVVGLPLISIVHKIIFEEVPSGVIAKTLHNDTSARGADSVRAQFKLGLTALAEHWGILRLEHRRSSYFWLPDESRPSIMNDSDQG